MVSIPDQPASPIDEPALPKAPGQTTVLPSDTGAGRTTPLTPAELAAVQAERRRIAQVLHDTVSQTLTGTYLLALVTARKLEATHPELAGDVTRLTETLQQAVVELQEIARGLQPETAPSAE